MSYIEHARLSSSLGLLFAVASAKAFVHAVIPDAFITSSTETVAVADAKMQKAGCHDLQPQPRSRL